MSDTFTARIDSADIPNMTMEEAIACCRKRACDYARTITLKAFCNGKYILLGHYEPMPVELMNLKDATVKAGDMNACLSTPVKPKKVNLYFYDYDE